MNWGRIDADFTSHPKVLALGSKQRRWTWLEILTYTWKYDSPLVPDAIRSAVPAATNAYLTDCENAGLIDRDAHGRRQVHDWVLFTNASISDKVAHYLKRFPQATANEVVRGVKGTRELVLHEVARQRESQTSGSDTGTTEPDNGGSDEPEKVVPKVVLARALTLTERNVVSGSSNEDVTQGRKEPRPPARANPPAAHEPEPNGLGEIESIGSIIDRSLAQAAAAKRAP